MTCPGQAKFESYLSQGQDGIQVYFEPQNFSLFLRIFVFNGISERILKNRDQTTFDLKIRDESARDRVN